MDILQFDSSNDESVRKLHNMLFQPSQNAEVFDDSDDSLVDEVDHLEPREDNSDTEQEADESSEEEDVGNKLTGRDNKTFWTTTIPKRNKRTAARNIVSHLPGVKRIAKDAKSPFASWSLLITDDMLNNIVKFTNYEISLVNPNYSRPRDAMDTDIIEIKGLIGLLYMMGKKKINRTNCRQSWVNDMSGDEFCRSVMGINRFMFLLRCMRFDDKTTRDERRKCDKLAPIRDIFQSFVQNSQQCYTVGEYVTVDEKLEAFRGRCSFRQYIPSKPARYGIKIFAMCDARTYYTANMEIYPGKQPQGPFSTSMSPSDVVMRLTQCIHGTGRNVTMDNWFSSFPLSELLLAKKLTMVGTLRSNKRELPATFAIVKNRNLYSTKFAFQEHKSLLSYKAKPNKLVLMLSTMHSDDKISDNSPKMKPEMVLFYNATKSGVDTVDQLCGNYDVSRNSRRWPMTVFYCILNVASINANIIYHGNACTEFSTREEYIKDLSFSLVSEHVKRRVFQKNMPKDIVLRVKNTFKIGDGEVAVEMKETQKKRKRCDFCDSSLNRVTAYTCGKCGRHICLKNHTAYMCKTCSRDIVNDSESE